MGTYFEEEHERSQWESGQALLHSESVKKHNDGQRENDRERSKENESYRVQNSYGTLRYLKKDKKKGEEKEGFAVEAFEAPNTRLHTDAEKHLDRKSIKKVKQNHKHTLYSSELPLRDQALFIDMRGGKKSADMIQYMKTLVQKQGHQTLKDTFGFLDQEEERAELEALKEKRKSEESNEQALMQKSEKSPEQDLTQKSEKNPEQALMQKSAHKPEQETEEKDFASHEDMISQREHQFENNKRIDTLNSRLRRKEALERQLRNDLQVMLDQRGREEVLEAQKDPSQNASETADTKQNPKQSAAKKDDSTRRRFRVDTEVSEADGTVSGADEDVFGTDDSSGPDEDGMPQDTVP